MGKSIQESILVYLGRRYHFKFFKACLPQILHGSFLITLCQIQLLNFAGTALAILIKFNLRQKSHYTLYFYKQLGSGPSPQSCLYFPDF